MLIMLRAQDRSTTTLTNASMRPKRTWPRTPQTLDRHYICMYVCIYTSLSLSLSL